jgi:hypothetical protein
VKGSFSPVKGEFAVVAVEMNAFERAPCVVVVTIMTFNVTITTEKGPRSTEISAFSADEVTSSREKGGITTDEVTIAAEKGRITTDKVTINDEKGEITAERVEVARREVPGARNEDRFPKKEEADTSVTDAVRRSIAHLGVSFTTVPPLALVQ